MLPTDNPEAAHAAAGRFAEPRATHYWDGERHLARHMARSLGIEPKHSPGAQLAEGVAWDVYLAYGRRTNRLEEPNFWMHQMWGLTLAPQLDAAEWLRRVRAMP